MHRSGFHPLRVALPAMLLLVGVGLSGAGSAAIPAVAPVVGESALDPRCLCGEEREALAEWRDRIAAAPTLEAARDLAISRTRLARKALAGARWVAPASPRIVEAHETLTAYEARIADSETPEQAAAEFGELVQLASLQGPALADINIDHDCDYTTGEIIAIVIGFVLGILPGIILLILLC